MVCVGWPKEEPREMPRPEKCGHQSPGSDSLLLAPWATSSSRQESHLTATMHDKSLLSSLYTAYKVSINVDPTSHFALLAGLRTAYSYTVQFRATSPIDRVLLVEIWGRQVVNLRRSNRTLVIRCLLLLGSAATDFGGAPLALEFTCSNLTRSMGSRVSFSALVTR